MDITKRKAVEERLQEYARAVEGAEEMIAVFDRDYRYLIANSKFLEMRNMTSEQVVGHFASEVMNEGVFEAVVKERVDECFRGKVVRFEMKYTYPALGERDVLVSYFPIEGANGVDRAACIVQDITERKLAEQALSTASQRLIQAQEQERFRIARELHDNINQRLGLLAVVLDGLKQSLPPWAVDVGCRIDDARKQAIDVGREVQALSHRLHTSKLDLLGLVAAAKSFCTEFADLHGVEVEFHSENVPKTLPSETALSLFRVLQEALQNAIKHSGSRSIKVMLRGGVKEIELAVHDSGVGFELEAALKGKGLGLTSMRERLKVVDGSLSVDSYPKRGTTLQARVPFCPKTEPVAAAAIRSIASQ